MANQLSFTDHLGSGDGGDTRSRVGQGLGVPKTPGGGTGRVPRSVDGPRSYGIRHATVAKVAKVKSASLGSSPSVPKAPKMPKLGNQLT